MISLNLALPIRLAVIEAENLVVTGEGAAFRKLEDCAEDYRARYLADGDDSPSAVDGIQPARSLYWALGIDPTKTRPSSEALLRRALNSKPLYSVNTLVDVCNWCSLDFLLPIGLYDRSKIAGSVTLRQGLEGESYEGIGKPPVNVTGRYVLADDAGPFGSPTSDSLRTSVTEETTETLMTIFAPSDYAPGQLKRQAEVAAARIREFCGGYTTRIEVIEGSIPPDPGSA